MLFHRATSSVSSFVNRRRPSDILEGCHITFPNSITVRAAHLVKQLFRDNWAQVQTITGRKWLLQYAHTVKNIAAKRRRKAFITSWE